MTRNLLALLLLLSSPVITTALAAPSWCSVAMPYLFNLAAPPPFTVIDHPDLHSFLISKPSLNSSLLTMESYSTSDPSSPYFQDFVFCKGKTQAALNKTLGIPVAGAQRQCAQANQLLVNRFGRKGLNVTFQDDYNCITGSCWEKQGVTQTMVEGTLWIRSPVLITPTIPFVPELSNVFYCKLLNVFN
jgi:hypothetical protein